MRLGFLIAAVLGGVYLAMQTLAVFANAMSAKDHAYGRWSMPSAATSSHTPAPQS